MKTSALILFSLLLILSANHVYAASRPTPDSNMILYYRLDRNASIGETTTLVVDSGLRSNNATVTGGSMTHSSTAGYFGDGAYTFPGISGNYINTSNDPPGSVLSTQGLTVMAWIKTNTLVSSGGDIVTRFIAASGQRAWDLQISSGKLRMQGSTDGNTVVTVTGATTIPSSSSYTHVAGVWNGTHMNVYVNGVLDSATGTALASIVNPTGVPIEIGRGRSGQNFNGTIDEVIVSNRSYSQAEIWAVYHEYLGCINASTAVSVAGNSTVCTNTYNVNGSTTGQIIVTTDNTDINLNGSSFYGNYSQGTSFAGRLVSATSKRNVTVRDGYVDNYYWGTYLGSGNNHVVSNVTYNNTRYSVGLDQTNSSLVTGIQTVNTTRGVYLFRAYNNNVTSSTFRNTTNYGIEFSTNSANNRIVSNTFNDTSTFGMGVFDTSTNTNNTITLNTFYSNYYVAQISGTSTQFTYNTIRDGEGRQLYVLDTGLYTNISNNNFSQVITDVGDNHIEVASSNVMIANNNFTNHTSYQTIKVGIVGAGISNVSVLNNTFDRQTKCIYVANASNVNISGNTCKKSITNYDGWNVGFYLENNRTNTFNPTNISITNNTIEDYGCIGILVRGSRNVTIQGNAFNPNNDQYYITNTVSCSYEAQAAIFIDEIYKGFIPVGTGLSDNITMSSTHYTDLVRVTGNTFNSNVKVLLRTQGVRNLTHDLTNHWFKSFQLPYLLDRDDFYIANTHNNISTINSTYLYSENLKQGINTNFTLDYSIYTNLSLYKSLASFPLQINLYNQTKTLIYSSNGTTYCTDIVQCSGNVNFTLSGSNQTYVLDNYNITQSYIRSNDPIDITNSGDTRIVSSALTTSISNITVVVNTHGDAPTNPRWRSTNGLYTKTFTPSEYTYNASTSLMTFTAPGIEPGANQLVIVEEPEAPSSVGGEGAGSTPTPNPQTNQTPSTGNTTTTPPPAPPPDTTSGGLGGLNQRDIMVIGAVFGLLVVIGLFSSGSKR